MLTWLVAVFHVYLKDIYRGLWQNNYMKKLAIILLLTGCVSISNYESPYTKSLDSKFDRKEVNEPEQNKISFGKLGNSLVSKSLITFVPVIIVRDDFEYGINNGFEGQISFVVNDQVQIFKRKTVKVTDKIIFPYIGTLENKQTGEKIQCFENVDLDPGLARIKSINNMSFFDYCIDSQGKIHTVHEYEYREYQDENFSRSKKNLGTYTIPLSSPYELTTQPKESGTGFKQEFIYNGRVNNSLKFIYREFNGDLARPSFTQEVQYDLNQSNIIGFKDLSIEILDATNQEIKYTVIKHF